MATPSLPSPGFARLLGNGRIGLAPVWWRLNARYLYGLSGRVGGVPCTRAPMESEERTGSETLRRARASADEETLVAAYYWALVRCTEYGVLSADAISSHGPHVFMGIGRCDGEAHGLPGHD